jgi:hypothetical protein
MANDVHPLDFAGSSADLLGADPAPPKEPPTIPPPTNCRGSIATASSFSTAGSATGSAGSYGCLATTSTFFCYVQ